MLEIIYFIIHEGENKYLFWNNLNYKLQNYNVSESILFVFIKFECANKEIFNEALSNKIKYW